MTLKSCCSSFHKVASSWAAVSCKFTKGMTCMSSKNRTHSSYSIIPSLVPFVACECAVVKLCLESVKHVLMKNRNLRCDQSFLSWKERRNRESSPWKILMVVVFLTSSRLPLISIFRRFFFISSTSVFPYFHVLTSPLQYLILYSFVK